MNITYQFPGFQLAHDAVAGDAYTHYPDGAISQRGPVPDDDIHATALGITPQLAALAHELAHHLIGSFFYRGKKHYNRPLASCAITYFDAHGWAMPEQADLAVWWITSFVYFSYRKPMPNVGDWGALMDMQKAGFDMWAAADKLQKLMRYESVEGVAITLPEALEGGHK